MSIHAGALRMGRRMAEARMTEQFTVYVTERTLGVDGVYTHTEEVLHAAVQGRVKFPTLIVTEREQGAQIPAVQNVYIHVPLGATPLAKVNTMWRCVSSTVDPSMVGRTFRTKGAPQAGQVTAHRYPVEEVS